MSKMLRITSSWTIAALFATIIAGCGGGSSSQGNKTDTDGNVWFDSSTYITSGSPQTSTIDSSVDADYFKFETNCSGTITVDLTNLTSDIDIELYDSGHNLLDSSADSGASNDQIIYNSGGAATFYVMVDGFGDDTGAYTLTVTIAACGDGNDTFGTATSITSGSAFNGTISDSTDFDYYLFTAGCSGTITVDLTNLTGDIDVKLYDSVQNEIGSSTNAGTADDQIVYSAAEGTYYVKVYGYSGATGDYALKATTACGDGNDTIGVATPISSGVDAAISADISTSSDIDYYQITSGCTGTISVSMTGLSADLDVKLFNPSHALSAQSSHSGSTSESITYNASTIGTYYIEVYPYAAGTSNYTLTVFVPPCEPDDSFGAASAVVYPSTTDRSISSSSDEDYYKFYIGSAGTITVDLTGLGADLDLYLYDSSQVLRGSSTQIGSTSEQIVYNTSAGGTYYIKVKGFSGATSSYTLYVH